MKTAHCNNLEHEKIRGKIAWLVPYPIKGSGGHRTIFSHIFNLAGRGHECHVYIGEDTQQNMSEEALRQAVESSFGPCPAQIHAGYETAEHFDLAVATAWWTAEIVAIKVSARHKLYFVQDFEPWFNPMGDFYLRAENSYQHGLKPLTIGRWLARLLHEKYNSKPCFFEFTADSSRYFPMESVTPELAVCFIYQPEKPRRCPLLGGDTLAIVKHHCPEVKIYTYGSKEKPPFNFAHTHLGVLSIEECNLLYNRCTVGLCMSSSNPSRVPFEMMAAGLPAVDLYGENTIYDMPEQGVLLAERKPASLAGAIIQILHSPELQEKMGRAGIRFMENRNVTLEFQQAALSIENILAGVNHQQDSISPLYQSEPFIAQYTAPDTSDAVRINDVHFERTSLVQRVRRNRIGRVLKVLWRGYY
jgi:hypothetical protein